MAGDWIPWTVGFGRKPEVAMIARDLGISRGDSALLLMELWESVGAQTTDGTIATLAPEYIDDITKTPGLAAAMIRAGWLESLSNGQGIRFPNWDRWNNRCAKQRLQANRHTAAYRARRNQTTDPAEP